MRPFALDDQENLRSQFRPLKNLRRTFSIPSRYVLEQILPPQLISNELSQFRGTSLNKSCPCIPTPRRAAARSRHRWGRGGPAEAPGAAGGSRWGRSAASASACRGARASRRLGRSLRSVHRRSHQETPWVQAIAPLARKPHAAVMRNFTPTEVSLEQRSDGRADRTAWRRDRRRAGIRVQDGVAVHRGPACQWRRPTR
jgi:hypothetical protein